MMLQEFAATGKVSPDVDSIMKLKQALGRAASTELLGSTTGDGKALLTELLPPVMHCNTSDEHHVSVQIAFLDLLATWLSRASKVVSSTESYKSELRIQIKDHWRPIFTLFFHRTAMSTATVSVGKEVLLKALQLQSVLYSKESAQERLEYLVHTILDMSASDKAVYLALEIIQKQASLTVITSLQPEFIAERLAYMSDDTLSTSLGRLISHILRSKLSKNADEAEQIAWVATWQDVILGALRTDDDTMKSSIFQYILPSVFHGLLPAYKRFLARIIEDAPDATSTQRHLVATLRMGKSEQLLTDVDPATLTALGLDGQFVERNIAHADALLRVASLGLVSECPKPTTFFSDATLALLQQHLGGFFLETDSYCRKEVLDALRSLLGRYQASLYYTKTSYRKAKLKGQDVKPIDQYIDRCKAFAAWFVGQLKYNLRPGSRFQLTTVSLQVIQIASGLGWSPAGMPATVSRYTAFKKSMTHNPDTQMALPFDVDMFDCEMVRLIVDRLGDSFDDNRTLAIGLLESLPTPIQGMSTTSELKALADNANALILSTRGRDGDGGARVIQFLFSKFLQGRVPGWEALVSTQTSESHAETAFTQDIIRTLQRDANRAKKDLLLAAQTTPLHGRLVALRYIVSALHLTDLPGAVQQAWQQVFEQSMQTILLIWDTVKEVLCTNSPEGFLPSSVQDRTRGPYRGPETQVILSYCWRALKESSALLQSVLDAEFRYKHSSVSVDFVRQAGDLYRIWLSEIRHRGAFTAAATDFVLVCERLERATSQELQELPWQWLQVNLGHLESSMHSKDITRRSGGLPMAIVSSLIAESSSSSRTRLFDFAVDYLARLGTKAVDEKVERGDAMELPQVHALNTLKDIFNESKLSARTVSCVERIFAVAVQGFNSSIWDIRNCSLMLFNAVLHRSFRSKKPRGETVTQTLTTESFFQHYPGLLPIASETLEASVGKLLQAGHASVTTALHPTLTLLSQLDVTENSDSWDNMSKTMQLVDACSTSEIWQIRSIAAQALPTFIERNEVSSFIVSSLNSMDTSKQNHLHGKLLQIHALFTYQLSRVTDTAFLNQLYGDITRALVAKFVGLTSENDCAVTKAQLLQLHIDFFTHNSLVDLSPTITRLKHMANDYCFRSLFKSKDLSNGPIVGQGALDRVMTLIVMQSSAEKGFKQFGDMSASAIMKRLFEHESADVRLTAYGSFARTFAGQAMLRSPTVLQTLSQQAVKETWSQTAISARACLARLPVAKTQTEDEQGHHLAAHDFDRYCTDLEAFTSASPLVDATLVLLGRLFQRIKQSAEDLSRYVALLERFRGEYMPLGSRRAVLLSLQASGLLDRLFENPEHELQDQLVALLPALFGSLTDDDDELREEAAAFVCKLVPGATPLRCSDARLLLLQSCLKRFPESATLKHELAILAVGLPREDLLASSGSRHVRQLIEGQIRAALEPSDLLFAVERQNLWRDPVEDCRVALSMLKNVKALPENANRLLAAFSFAGMHVLEACMDECGPDGPLGWCSREGVYSLFNQVLQCTQFTLSCLSVQEDRKMQIEECLYRLNHGPKGEDSRKRLEQTRLHESLRRVIAEYA